VVSDRWVPGESRTQGEGVALHGGSPDPATGGVDAHMGD
jgi:hypothetical protein